MSDSKAEAYIGVFSDALVDGLEEVIRVNLEKIAALNLVVAYSTDQASTLALQQEIHIRTGAHSANSATIIAIRQLQGASKL